jgi:hypothetical protein
MKNINPCYGTTALLAEMTNKDINCAMENINTWHGIADLLPKNDQ